MAKLSDLVNGPAHNNESHGQQHNGNEANSGMDTSSAVAQNAHVLNPFNIPNLNVSITLNLFISTDSPIEFPQF